ncbi:MAG: LuxR C-terminal-related transcriptional regulator [Tannerellaceae bacterium]|jgi:DNA-binding CsgD family transcriptional regulator|nr:LuxR C-terminal-related transcriptional regulator [Tannerellaceae bacterium]
MDELRKEYERLLSLQAFDEAELDYTLLETQHKPRLTQLAKLSNSVTTVFDMHLKKHIFTSPNFFALFGRDADIEGMDKNIHPDDVRFLLLNAIAAIKFIHAHKEDMTNYKFITEYRIRHASGEYIRVIEQQSLLEADKAGNPWLALSVLDLSPDQSLSKPVKSGIFSLKEKSFFSFQALLCSRNERLSPREIEILQMVRDGLLSKEISNQLCISVHTVNTHRQRILEKLDVDNSLEAVKYASVLGLLS